MFRIVAKTDPNRPSAYIALEEGETPEQDLLRVIDVSAKMAYPPVSRIRYMSRLNSPLYELDDSNDARELADFLVAHPEIEDLDTPEKFRLWHRQNPQAHESPVDPSNTVGAYLRKMESLGLHTPEQRRAHYEKERAKRREEIARRKAGGQE